MQNSHVEFHAIVQTKQVLFQLFNKMIWETVFLLVHFEF